MHEVYDLMRPIILFQILSESILITLQPFLTVLVSESVHKSHSRRFIWKYMLNVIVSILEPEKRCSDNVTGKHQTYFVSVDQYHSLVHYMLFVHYNRQTCELDTPYYQYCGVDYLSIKYILRSSFVSNVGYCTY